MKKIISFIVCITYTAIATAQTPAFQWAKNMGGSFEDKSYSITVDAAGNVYTTGVFRWTADFDPGPGIFNLTGTGAPNIFISKLDAGGNFLWAKNIGGANFYNAYSISVDASGNVYTTGEFDGTADFDPGPGAFNLTSAGGHDVFISKLESAGNFVWAKQLGGTGFDDGLAIAVDATGNVYTTGYFSGTADFDPGAGIFSLTSAGSSEIFISKLDVSGNFVWAKMMGGTAYDHAHAITVDASGNIYTAGTYYGTADFDPGAGINNLTAVGYVDIFVSKIDASGNFVWAKSMGGTTDDRAFSIATDASGNVYSTGQFNGAADFNPGPATFTLFASGGFDIFISKLDAQGNFVWAKNMGGDSTDIGNSIKVDVSGNVYTTGLFWETVDFNPGPGVYNLTSGGASDVFISKLDALGNFVWAKNIAGGNYDYGNSIAIDASENVYTTGSFAGTADFDPGAGTFNLTSPGASDIFVQKMSQCTPPSATVTPAGPTTFCTGGSVVLNAPVAANRAYQWKKGGVDIAGATLSSYTVTTSGTYKVTVTNTLTGCAKTTSAGTKITVNTKPGATATPQGPTTFCAGGSVVLQANTGTGFTYKWKRGSNFISGATLSNYTATTAGTYRVEVINSNGCSKLSAGVTVTVPCRDGDISSLKSNLDFSVYPNPNAGEFTIEFSIHPTSRVQIDLTDALGNVVKRFETNDETIVINESNLANGIYCLTVRNEDQVSIKKINIIR